MRGDTRGAAVLPGLVCLVLAVGSSVAADSGGDPGRHHDHGRFTAQSEGFPPQIRGMEQVRARPAAQGGGRGGDRSAAAARAALADPRVERALGGSHVLLGVTPQGLKSARPGTDEVALYSHAEGRTVLATVSRGRVDHVSTVPAGRWQAPLLGVERDEAVRIARRAFSDAGDARVRALDGFAIHALEPDGTPFDVRMAYVTFHAGVDARPERSAWVDLTSGRVVRSSRQAEPQSRPAGPGGTAGGTRLGVDPAAMGDHVEWRGWRFDVELSRRVDGVSLASGTYQGVSVFERLSFPVMTVFYDHPDGTPEDARCGPYVDRLGPPELTPVPWFDDQPMVRREFTLGGVDWLEFGILDTLGDYVMYQAFYVSELGEVDAHVFAKGIQCEFDHVHYPFWRLDLDVAGPDGDRILRARDDGTEEAMTEEFGTSAADAARHGWSVVDPRTSDRVRIGFDDGTWTVPGAVIAEAAYEDNLVFGRRATPAEQGEWRQPASDLLGFDEDEPIADTDVVVWYRGLLPHATSEGPDVWHSTGVRLTVELAPRFHPRPSR